LDGRHEINLAIKFAFLRFDSKREAGSHASGPEQRAAALQVQTGPEDRERDAKSK